MTDESETWGPIAGAAACYGMNYFRLYRLYRGGRVLGRKLSSGKVQINLPSLENYLLPPGWTWLQDAVRRYGVGKYTILRLVQKGQVRARKTDVRWQIEVTSLERALKAREVPAGWVTTKEAGRRLKVGIGEVERRIQAGHLRSRWQGRRLLVGEASLQTLIVPPGWLTTREAAERAGVSMVSIIRWIQKGRVQGRKVHGRWIVKEESHPEKVTPPPGWIWLSAVPGVFRVKPRAAHRLVQKGRVKARNVGGRWQVEVASLEAAIAVRCDTRDA